MEKDDLFVRLREYKRAAGQTARSRGILDPVTRRSFKIGINEKGERPWHRVPRRIGELFEVMQVDEYADGSPLCCEVCEEDEARVLDKMAQRRREAKKAIEQPTVDTAMDLTRGETTTGDLMSADVAPPSRGEAMAAATTPAAKPKPKSTTKKSGRSSGRRKKSGR